jgi:hypothetical protein
LFRIPERNINYDPAMAENSGVFQNNQPNMRGCLHKMDINGYHYSWLVVSKMFNLHILERPIAVTPVPGH